MLQESLDSFSITGAIPLPNCIYTSSNCDRAKRLLLKPIVGPLVSRYLGTVVKKCRQGRPVDSLNVAAYPTAFYLTCLPVHALREMWMLQASGCFCDGVSYELCVFLEEEGV